MPDIFDELQEDLRAERARQLGMRYGGILAAVALVALIGIGGWQGWRWYEQRESEAAAATFLTVHRETEQQGADLKAAAEKFDAIAAQAPAGYRTLARLRAAALKSELGDLPGALAEWDAVANDSAADPLYRDLASLNWVLHGLDTQDPTMLAARVTPLAAEGNPWRASARELQALVAIRQGNMAEARRILEGLSADMAAPQALRDRAGRILAQLPNA
ncbi:tetratricopeptide repeat protein [Roseomonas xinghualingensis]|uniref:tetratricopeptide repeat protein n=1 Tax=Roseomonas xinghualingensis TaxID=2986475 RepID=UPI0021F0B587|nr:tetratricopeptide repeat protein [Roseomonas sp. SXEYE001]MCV4206549.1 tetratricopeptide repeat protein [Roseomonas sp. SXEYE001]